MPRYHRDRRAARNKDLMRRPDEDDAAVCSAAACCSVFGGMSYLFGSVPNDDTIKNGYASEQDIVVDEDDPLFAGAAEDASKPRRERSWSKIKSMGPGLTYLDHMRASFKESTQGEGYESGRDRKGMAGDEGPTSPPDVSPKSPLGDEEPKSLAIKNSSGTSSASGGMREVTSKKVSFSDGFEAELAKEKSLGKSSASRKLGLATKPVK